MDRRSFVKYSGIASSALFFPKFLRNAKLDIGANSKGRKLVVIQLSGGNDGLNTIIPINNDIYYKLRPSLSIPYSDAIKIEDEFGLNPGLEALRDLYNNGEWAIVNNVGYPNPDRSHFRSMDIWHTASGSEEYLQTGWLGRYLDHNCTGKADAHKALEINDELSLVLKGQSYNGFVMNDPKLLKRSLENPFVSKAPISDMNENLDYLYKVLADTKESADYIYERSKTYNSKVNYPQNEFGKSMKMVAELINGGNDSTVYYVSLSGFDTHVFQQGKQKRLLKNYAEAVSAFIKDLKGGNMMDETLIMTFSEFGRRVAQNASGGTDHGTANNIFLMGSKLKKAGIYGGVIDLEDLDNGDLKYKVDFRSVYADVIQNWLETDIDKVMKTSFEPLSIV